MLRQLQYMVPFLIIVSCQTRPASEFTLQKERAKFIAEKTFFIDSVFALVPDSTNENPFIGAFWASELMLIRSPAGKKVVNQGLRNFNSFSYRFKRSLLQNAYALYHPDCINIIDSLIKTEEDEKLFAMMAEYILLADNLRLDAILTVMKERFSDWESNPVLKGMTLYHSGYDPVSKKDLDDLIRFRAYQNEASIYVIVDKNRDLPGYAIIQHADGHIIKSNNDTLRIKLLARSITNLPGYLTNGNTPTGVLSMQTLGVSDNIFIGPTPTVITFLPFEISLEDYSFGKQKSDRWTMEIYDRFFPESWSNLTQKNMAYYAGEAGRSEIIMHGSTIDEEYYRNQVYYPYTPSLGCFCTLERWDTESGVQKESEQMKLISTLKRHRIEKALVYLIEQ